MAQRSDQTHGEAGTVPKSDQALHGELRQRLAGSLLPGDEEPTPAELDEAAEFMLEAARQRPRDEGVLLLRTAGGERRRLRIAAINQDMPFLVDSISAAVASQGLAIDRLIHPILPVRRDGEGQLAAFPSGEGHGEKRESMIYLETPRIDARERRALEEKLAAALADVRAAVADWPRMREAMTSDADRIADAEGAALLRWLAGGMLTQLGHVLRKRDGGHAQALGICRRQPRGLLADEAYERAFAWFDGGAGHHGRVPLIVKANHISRVHRRVPIDLFIVPVLEGGRVTALSVHAGIWTSAALAALPGQVPVLRRQLDLLMDGLKLERSSHDGKALIHALTQLPHDLMIGLSDADAAHVTTTMMALGDRPRPRCAVVEGALGRHAFAFVWLPRDMLSTSTRLRILDMLEQETGAVTLDWSLTVEEGNLAMLRFVLDVRGVAAAIDTARIDARLQEMLRGWSDAVEAALRESEEGGRSAALATRYAEAFPLGYRNAYGAAEAARDIQRIRHLGGGEDTPSQGRDARLYRLQGDQADQLRLKIYQHGGWMPLSDVVPALENFGFRVLTEMPTQLASGEVTVIHDFQLALPPGTDGGELLKRADAIEQAVVAVINGLAENDVFNRLVVGTALSAREADWLRAIYRYLRQANIAFTIYTVVDALGSAPQVTRGLIELFRARHDPDFTGDRAGTAIEDTIRDGLAAVDAINDDRLLRLYWATLCAILRTNAFAPAGAEALAFKLDSAEVPDLPKPVPWREIFVYSRRVEGIHLRAGPVARGGLRWSDRRDDFRTEILGLMKAQRVKNAVIVPTGAKGGFYPKQLPNPAEDRDAWFAEGTESYKLFIRTLLSVTDNIVGEKVVHPDRVVIHDGEDPYFVVAADKGTATFSDTANAIAIERDFWLGDAFASGGSNGYDHKAMGITARGAWISVQRHFLEMGVDVQKDPVRVAGCGDMSGDVFGNGMLLSKVIKLVAAFDHRHIFIDPDPDAAASWKERQRLFKLPRSSWADYSAELLSKGGGIYPRTLKTISLSREAQIALGIDKAEIDPDSLIRAVLKSPVDLLWFGGIGTYIKAAGETNQQVGDPANDALRIDGAEVCAKVIGEGANLGVTQAGRIEFALAGGRINTDFIDNSAGVDCSDNEVNIKIALASARRAGRLSEERRNALLGEMTGEVADLVLEDNRLQALALSIAQTSGAGAVASQIRLIETLEKIGGLDRRTEGLADGQTLARRAAEGQGLTRPELAVLLSNAKLALQDAVEDTALSEDEAAVPLLLGDFPEQMHDSFRKAILTHRLRNQIVATVVANDLVNRMGLLHPFELAEEEGATLGHVATSFVTACSLLGVDHVWDSIDRGTMPEGARLLLFDQTALALRSHMADLLRSGAANVPPSRVIVDIGASVAELRDHVDDLLAPESRDHAEAIAARLIEAGAPPKIALSVAGLFALDGAIGLARLAQDCRIKPVSLAHAFIDLGARMGLDWAQTKASVMSPSDPWERLLVAGLARDFQQMRFDFLRRHLREGKGKPEPMALVDRWTAENEAAIDQFRGMVTRAQNHAPISIAALAQIASQARNLVQR